MRGHSFLRAGLMLVLLPALLLVQTPVPVHSAATATYTFTGTVYVIEGTAQELAGVTLGPGPGIVDLGIDSAVDPVQPPGAHSPQVLLFVPADG